METPRPSFKPLIVIFSVILIGTFAIAHNSLTSSMHIFMGLFFIIFAMFKLFDLHGFVKGFLMYDLISQRFRAYAYFYPLIELALGVSYLGDFAPAFTDLLTIAIMFASAAGVIKAIGSGMDVRCACLGTTLNVPLSTVSIIENVGMGLMAIYSLIML